MNFTLTWNLIDLLWHEIPCLRQSLGCVGRRAKSAIRRLTEILKSGRYYAKTLQSPLRYKAFIVSVAFDAFQAMQTAQGIIDCLFFDNMKAGDVAQFFEPCRNFNSCISDSPCDLGIFQFHHRHSVKIYPKLFITIRHTFTAGVSASHDPGSGLAGVLTLALVFLELEVEIPLRVRDSLH